MPVFQWKTSGEELQRCKDSAVLQEATALPSRGPRGQEWLMRLRFKETKRYRLAVTEQSRGREEQHRKDGQQRGSNYVLCQVGAWKAGDTL